VTQPRRDTDLAEKALAAQRGRELGPDDFHGDGSVVLEILRQIDTSHAAAPEFALDPIAPAEDVGKR